MSYAGTYGADETCPHGTYWRSCDYCNTLGPRPAADQIAALRENQALRKKNYLAHPDDVLHITVSSRVITVYDAKCPNPSCSWGRVGISKEALDAAIDEHMEAATRVAHQWRNVNPREAYVDPDNR